MNYEKAAYTPAEVARLTGFSLRNIDAAIKSGDLRAKTKPPAHIYRFVLPADIDKWLNSHRDA